MEEPSAPKTGTKTGDVVPYRRVYDRDAFVALANEARVNKLEEMPSDTSIALCLYQINAQRSLHDARVSLISSSNTTQTLTENTPGLCYVFENPTFRIQEPDKEAKDIIIPGYIKINFIFIQGYPELSTIEFSNATLHDIIFNPTQANTLSIEQPKYIADAKRLALHEAKKYHKALNSMLNNLTKSQKEKSNSSAFDKDKNRNMQAYISPSEEERLKKYYRQEMLSFFDVLLTPAKLSFSAENNVKIWRDEQNRLRLSVIFSSLSITDPVAQKKYSLLGTLTLDYVFVEKKGFQFQQISSDNEALLKLFSIAAFAPTKVGENIRNLIVDVFTQEPAKSITTEAELLRLANGPKKPVEDLLRDIHKPKKAAEQTSLQKDTKRKLVFSEDIDESTRTDIERFFVQDLLSLPVYICAAASSQQLMLKGKDESTTQKFLTENGKPIFRSTLTDPQFMVRNPYDDTDSNLYNFSGKITFEYTFDKETGFTFTGLHCSNNVLYNLIMNPQVIFPQDPDNDPKSAQAFNATIRKLQETAAKQEERSIAEVTLGPSGGQYGLKKK